MTSFPEDSSVPAELRTRIQDDPWTRALGVQFLALGRGFCRLGLTVQPHMVNFQGYPHGGVIFSLADIAFGAACNSHGEPAVALIMTISFLTAVPAGSRLVAEAREIKQGRRAGFYQVDVTSEMGALVAQVHCVAHRMLSLEVPGEG
ncbi:MAG: hotdog fold thioesterase [Candidatus Rokubacteria bacterium]|nr:hotdog fold thioesterase [Candidatus Rokubacteria bacterium]